MTDITMRRVHPAARMHADEYAKGQISRREFLTRATALGVSATAAYGLIGAAAPARAESHVQDGGTLRIQMEVRALKDPRTSDWPQISNVCRGWLEYLVEYQADGSFRGMLLDSWEVSDDARTYTLRVREGVTWNNGDAFTAEDVAQNFRRWCDRNVEGNSMASRMGDMVDPETGTAREGVIEVVDDLTLRLNLTSADISIIANVTDYPAAVVHPSYEGGDMTSGAGQIGTGAYILDSHEVGVRSVLVKNPDHQWWGAEAEGFGGATLERIEFIDYGTDPAAWLAALESDEVDMLYESVGEFIEIMDSLDLVKSEVVTANTICIRCNQVAEINGQTPYADARVRRAMALAVDNSVLLELGYSGLGTVANNHHVCPIHPEYAEIEGPGYDPDAAMALLEEAGMADFEHELISIDDDWRKNTTDAMAAQLRDAGIQVRRTILPGSTFWNDWAKFPFSSTNWNQRPLGVQVLALAYRSGEAWNECAYSNPEFDAKLAEAMGVADAGERREIMAEIQQILIDDGVIVQPYWRSVYRHYRPNIVGAEAHPSYEIRPYSLALGA